MIKSIKNFFNILPSKTKNKIWLMVLYQVIKFLLEMISFGALIPLIFVIVNGQTEFLIKIEPYLNSLNLPDMASMKSEEIFLLLLSVITATFFLKFIILSLITYFEARWVEFGRLNLSKQLFNNYVFDYRNFSERKTNEMFRNITELPVTFFRKGVQSFYVILGDVFKFLGFSIVLISVNLNAFLLIVSVLTLLIAVILIFIKPRVKLLGQEKVINDGFYIKYINEGLSSSKEIFLSKNPNFFIDKFFHYGKKNIIVKVLDALYSFIPKQLIELFGVIILCLIIYYLKLNSSLDSSVIFVIGVYMTVFIRLLPIGNNINLNIKQIFFGISAFEVLYKEIKIKKKFDDFFKNKKKFKDDLKTIKIENLNFKYPKTDNHILKNINLEFSKGKIYCLYGASGTGKTTMLNLIMNFLSPTSGKILINDEKINNDEFIAFDKISYLSQKIFLLNDTVAKNIAFSEDEKMIDYRKVQECLDITNLTDEIKDLNLIVGDDGSFLSGGQKQRIGVARALYFEKELLILDEMTSSLDSKNENIIMSNLNKIKKNKIIIVSSHSKNVMDQCDHKIELTN